MCRKYVAIVVSLIVLSFVICSACAAPPAGEVIATVEVEKIVQETTVVEKVVEVTAAPHYSDYVTVLVVDDFENANFPKESLGKGDLCVVALHEQWVFKAEGACVDSCARPHGWLVYEEIESQIKSHYPDSTSERLSPITGAWGGMDMNMWETSEGNILLVPVDTQGYETSLIAERISEVVEGLAHNPPVQLAPLTRGVVLNMSFAFIPCKEIANAEGYLEQLAADDATRQFVENLSYNDFLYNMVIGKEKPLSIPVVAVAAAGNESTDFPYAPALLDGIVSVSALPVGMDCSILPDKLANRCGDHIGDRSTAWYSNYGEVMLDGNHSTATVAYSGITVPLPGTSFAAPKMSFWVARYLLRKTEAEVRELRDYCSLLYPPYGTWRNWELGSADAVNICSDFP